MTENVNAEAARLCREAAQVIEERGHAKHTFMKQDTGAVCMWGALGVAFNDDPCSIGGLRPASDDLYYFFNDLFEKKLDLNDDGLAGATTFNDLPETTPQDVQKFLLSAADEIEFQS